jgi:hypothetical protein
MRYLAALALALVAGTAHTGPTARFGLTWGAKDPQAQSVELGPMVTLGDRIGPFVAEGEWAYLSFLDPDASITGVHRLGLNLRMDLITNRAKHCWSFACTRGSEIYAEAGAAERYGRWRVDAYSVSPRTTPQPELHVGVGLELNNQVWPNRNGWQLGLRFAVAPSDPPLTAVCRGSCPTTTTSGGTEKALFVEWMFLVGD